MLENKNNNFYLDDKVIHIYSGAVHYFRSFPDYWEDILTKLKLCGFNTVETYVSWNMHEKTPGEFDFSGSLDIVRFIETAKKVGLYVIVRPGPYICAEWDAGGLPAWLFKDSDMRIRCMYEPYLKAVERFYRELFKLLVPLQHSNGGNIIAFQVENEYGSYGNDKQYLKFLKDLMIDCGAKEKFFTSDGPEDGMLSGGPLDDGTFKVANFGSRPNYCFKTLAEYQSEGPMMCGEYWNGWFDHWSEKHHFRNSEPVVSDLKEMLSSGASFNFYMFYGGTNFGFSAGANYANAYQPTVTSYDDDALINEWGGYTKKYHAVRKALLDYQKIEPAKLPDEPALQNVGRVELNSYASFLENIDELGTKVTSIMPEYMERFSQNSGFILYHHKLKGNYSGKLYLDGLHDRAHIFINKQLKGIIYRNDKNNYISLDKLKGENDIDVLVENMGRINYGPEMPDRKGVRQIRIDNQVLSHWDVWLLPLDNVVKLDFSTPKKTAPVFMKGSFKAQPGKSCFVHLNGFTKGYVYVNGFNLGRYWKVGPQKSLYLPGVLLKETNEVIVLELDNTIADTISILDWHDIGQKKSIFSKK